MCAGKQALEQRLTTTQLLLQQQEEAARRGERERRSLSDKVKELERALHGLEVDKKHAQVHAHSCGPTRSGVVASYHSWSVSMSTNTLLGAWTSLAAPYGSTQQCRNSAGPPGRGEQTPPHNVLTNLWMLNRSSAACRTR